MAVLSWGGPTIGFTLSKNGAPEANAEWKNMPDIKQGTAQLTTEAGEKTEALNEFGEVVDTRTAKSKYTLEFQVFVKKGDKKPIEDADGVILDNYAVRLTPEDPTNEGFQMDNCSVSCEETWSSADGKLWKYTFSGLKPKEGSILKSYLAKLDAGSEPGTEEE